MNTPYDDSFRTILTDCRRLVIPLVNEMFSENYDIRERVELHQNELYITNGDDKKRITDSNISFGTDPKRYHIECQSTADGTILVRIFEYASQVAVTTAETNKTETHFKLPHSGILYLRSDKNISSTHTIIVEAPNGTNLVYEVPALFIQDYTLDDLFDKELWFLIPFHFFNYQIQTLEKEPSALEDMIATYNDVWKRLDQLVKDGILTFFEYQTIKKMCEKVAKSLSKGHENVEKGVEKIMGGCVLEYEAKTIRNEAIEEAIINMLDLGVDEHKIKEKYPDMFDSVYAKYKRKNQ